jgi:hypothetical protein
MTGYFWDLSDVLSEGQKQRVHQLAGSWKCQAV